MTLKERPTLTPFWVPCYSRSESHAMTHTRIVVRQRRTTSRASGRFGGPCFLGGTHSRTNCHNAVMSWRWLLFDYADPHLPLSFWRRIRISWRTLPVWKLPKELRRGRYWLGLALVPPAVLPMVALAAGLPPWMFFVLFMLFYWVWFSVAYGVCCRKEHFFRIRLEGFNCCANCGYWLRGLNENSTRCPECGSGQPEFPERPPSTSYLRQTRFRLAWLKDKLRKGE